MQILAIECSSELGSICFYQSQKSKNIFKELSFAAGAKKKEKSKTQKSLFNQLNKILEQKQKANFILCGLGPGSYTGVRITLSVAIGLSISDCIPIIGLPSFLGIETNETDYFFLGKANFDIWYLIKIKDNQQNGKFIFIPAKDTKKLQKITEKNKVYCIEKELEKSSPAILTKIKASKLAQVVCSYSIEQINNLKNPEPIYLSPPYQKPELNNEILKKINSI